MPWPIVLNHRFLLATKSLTVASSGHGGNATAAGTGVSPVRRRREGMNQSPRMGRQNGGVPHWGEKVLY